MGLKWEQDYLLEREVEYSALCRFQMRLRTQNKTKHRNVTKQRSSAQNRTVFLPSGVHHRKVSALLDHHLESMRGRTQGRTTAQNHTDVNK